MDNPRDDKIKCEVHGEEEKRDNCGWIESEDFEGKNFVSICRSNEPLPGTFGCHNVTCLWGVGGSRGKRRKNNVRIGHINHVKVGGPI
jgi:hypothetical protein